MTEAKIHKAAIQALESCYNSSNFESLDAWLSEDAVYESQWVLKPLKGKRAIMHYFKMKMETIRKTKTLVTAKEAVLRLPRKLNKIAEGTMMLYYKDREPCLIISQHNEDNVVAVLLIKMSGSGLIERMDLCMPQLFSWDIVGEDKKEMAPSSFGIDARPSINRKWQN